MRPEEDPTFGYTLMSSELFLQYNLSLHNGLCGRYYLHLYFIGWQTEVQLSYEAHLRSQCILEAKPGLKTLSSKSIDFSTK